MRSVLIVGTGAYRGVGGACAEGCGLQRRDCRVDASVDELRTAVACHAIDEAVASREDVLRTRPDVVVLATPVLPILDWMQQLAAVLSEAQFITDVGSTKREIATAAEREFNRAGRARFLPGHPMAGKESGGAALADATLFRGATWLFTPISPETEQEADWRGWVERMGAVTRDLAPAPHDEVCAWVSHLPQMLSTALAALLEDTFAGDPEKMAAVQAIGGARAEGDDKAGRESIFDVAGCGVDQHGADCADDPCIGATAGAPA